MSLSVDRLKTAFSLLLLAGIAVALAKVTWDAPGTGDYSVHTRVLGDNAGPAFNALIHGHLAATALRQPLMGLTSLLWRAPFGTVARLLGGGGMLVYEVGELACLLPLAGLIVWLGRHAGDQVQLRSVALAAAAMLVGPATNQALHYGHPEELLAGALATSAVLCASRQRRGAAAILLGLAIGTKQWAVLAVPCILLAVPDGRIWLGARAMLVGAPLTAVLPLTDPAAFSRADAFIGAVHVVVPMSAWWAVTTRFSALAAPPEHLLPFGLTRMAAAPLGLALAAAAIVIYGRLVGAGRRTRVDGVALLALVCMLRCELDPAPVVYYFAPAVLALAVWEVNSLGRLPVVTVAFCVWLAVMPTTNPPHPDALNAVWLGGMLALAMYLARGALRPAVAPAGCAPRPRRRALDVRPSR